MNLEELVNAFCIDSNSIKEIQARFVKKQDDVLQEIDQYIQESLLDGQIISLKNLRKKYKKISYSCIYNILTKKRNEIERSGKKIEKIGLGKYQIILHEKTN